MDEYYRREHSRQSSPRRRPTFGGFRNDCRDSVKCLLDREAFFFFNSIIHTIYHYMPESKQANMDGEGKVKAKTRLSTGKVLVNMLVNRCGILHIDFLHEYISINTTYHSEFLTEARLKQKTWLTDTGHDSSSR